MEFNKFMRNGWNDVTDVIPNDNDKVILYRRVHAIEHVFIAAKFTNNSFVTLSDPHAECFGFTHWRILEGLPYE